MEAPKLDTRRAEDVVAQALSLAKNVYLAGVWQGTADPGDPAFRLVGVFGRLMEILIERLNRVPEKNLLAFLDTVGVEASPGFPAAVPVTFLPSPKATDGGPVAEGTQVATTQTDQADAQVFETRRAIHATPAKLMAAVNLLPAQDRYSLLGVPPLPPKPEDLANAPAIAVLAESAARLTDLPHVLYVESERLFGRKEVLDVTLDFSVASGDASVLNATTLRWQRFDKNAKTWVATAATYPVSAPGHVQVLLTSFGANEKTTVAGREGFWVACSYDGGFPAGASFPMVSGLQGSLAPAGSTSAQAAAQPAFANNLALDLTKPFFPFAQRPRYGDALYVSSPKALATDVDSVTVTVDLKAYTQSQLEDVFASVVDPTTVATVALWQYLATDGTWKQLTKFENTLTVTPGAPPAIARVVQRDGLVTTTEDGTFFGLAGTSQGTFTFTLPADLAQTGAVHGAQAPWLRVLLKSDDPYGRDSFVASTTPLTVVGATLIPPVVEGFSFSFTYKSQLTPVAAVVTENNLTRIDHDAGGTPGYPLGPFVPPLEQGVGVGAATFAGGHALYLGFDRAFGDVYVSLYFRVRESYPSVDTPAEGGQPILAWEYLAADGNWKALDVEDTTTRLSSAGTVSFAGKDDALAATLFGAGTGALAGPLYWIRARLASGYYQQPPALRGIFTNTVMADNRYSFRSELLLGSGNGRKSQTLKLPKAPVLGGELWVREPETPPQAEGDALREELARYVPTFAGEQLADPEHWLEPAEGTDRQVWVRWVRVPNFLGSLARSRHYTLDSVGGTLALGDGTQGLLAPILSDNLQFRGFRSGGGELANQVALPLAVKELKSSLPYVDKVFNVEAAVGGADAWDAQDVLSFGPQFIKNKGRAVSSEDFEWMVMQRFSQVARVKCLATRVPSPSGLVFKPGAVTLIVVPKSHDRFPRPTAALLETIRAFLAEQSLGAIVSDVHVLGPGFTEVTVRAQVRALDPRTNGEVERRALQALESFFHPLEGGEDGRGWAFGRDVQSSEVYAVLQRVEGVDYVNSVEFANAPGASVLDIGEHDLVASGFHQIAMI